MQDAFLYRMVVATLAAVMLTAMLGAIGLSGLNIETPAVVVALGSAASGALTGLLVPAPSRLSRARAGPGLILPATAGTRHA